MSARGLALRANVALLDITHQLRPLVTRHAKRARDQAVPAPNAFRGIVSDRPEGGFLERSYQACGSTRRILTVHAHAPHEPIATLFHNRERRRRELQFGFLGETMRIFTRLLAAPASDALGHIYEDGFCSLHNLLPCTSELLA